MEIGIVEALVGIQAVIVKCAATIAVVGFTIAIMFAISIVMGKRS